MDGIRALFAGQYAILAWFLLAVVAVYIPAMTLRLSRRKRQSAAFLRQHRNAAAAQILRGKATGVLTVHAVDGEKPVLTSKGARLYFYLAPGEHILQLSYRWDKISLIGKLSPYFYANQTAQGKERGKAGRGGGEWRIYLALRHQKGNLPFPCGRGRRTRKTRQGNVRDMQRPTTSFAPPKPPRLKLA
ncbi:MAG: hypothetical protein LBI57_03820 [Helicobacteraceae bacterium]|nr:hypothetical protein [Helicobacteraceae bacterium]